MLMKSTCHIVCPHCHAVNRVSAARAAEQPKCGQCHEALLDAAPRDLDGEAFRKHVSRNDVPVVVDFWAPWCGPCRAMAPEFERAAAELGPAARLVKLNTDEEQAIAAEFAIRGIPTVILFENGREVARRSGAMRSADIVQWVKAQARAA
jgi:thioredoxin 2